VYECEVRAFRECQSIPKRILPVALSELHRPATTSAPEMAPAHLWKLLHEPLPPMVIDVREPREFQRGHIPQALLVPLPRALTESLDLPVDCPVVFVCRGGRRSARVAAWYASQDLPNIYVLQGGMLAWQAAGLIEALEISRPEEGE